MQLICSIPAPAGFRGKRSGCNQVGFGLLYNCSFPFYNPFACLIGSSFPGRGS